MKIPGIQIFWIILCIQLSIVFQAEIAISTFDSHALKCLFELGDRQNMNDCMSEH